jgi:hypothetical protein
MSKQSKTRRVHILAYNYDMPLKTHQLQCAWCGRHTLVTRYPGCPPRFCSTECAAEDRKAHDCARKAAGKEPATVTQPDGQRWRGCRQKYPRVTLPADPGAGGAPPRRPKPGPRRGVYHGPRTDALRAAGVYPGASEPAA